MPSINLFSSLLPIRIKSSTADFKCSWPFNGKNLPTVSQPLVWTELQFVKFQNILISAFNNSTVKAFES